MLRKNIICRFAGGGRRADKKTREKLEERFGKKIKEKELHPYFSKGRAFYLLREFQRLRNLNRHTIKYDKATMNEFTKKAEEFSLYCTHEHFEAFEEYQDHKRCVDQAINEIQTLPDRLKAELMNEGNSRLPRSQEVLSLYWDQLIRILPPQMVHIYKAGRKLRAVFEDKLEHHED
ncbi:unnamed protein product [Blepharisma stoltei]|uniref:Uncharacterized protein n=1 Tax=Blepharisma stoltei TaxID=1481888 RepID=A0AAU9IR82_9CILI|nr:unnamed protein product [Blepharisma stoltei]